MTTPSDDSGGSAQRSDGLTLKTFDGLIWLLSSSGLQSLLGLLILAVLARLLPPGDFGIIAAAHIVLGFARLTSQLGVGAALVQLPELDEKLVRTGFTFSVTLGLVLASIIWVLSPYLAQAFRLPALGPVIQLLTWVFPLQAITSISSSLIQRKLNYRRLAGVDVISYGLGYGAVAISLAFLDFGVWALVWGGLAQSALAAIVYFWLQPHSVLPQWNWNALRELLSYGSAFTLSSVLNFLARKGDSFVVGRWLKTSPLGIYDRAYSLMDAANSIVGTVVNKVFFPAFAKIQKDTARLASAYRRSVGIVALLMLPLSALSLVLAPEIVDLLLGKQWHNVILPLQVLALGMFFRLSYKVAGTLIRGVGAVNALAWCQAVYAIFAVGGAWIGHHWGVAGVAMSTLVALVVQFILLSTLAMRLCRLPTRAFLSAHFQAVNLTAISLAICWGSAELLRLTHLPSLFRLVGTLATLALIGGVLLKISPQFVLGRNGIWLLEVAHAYLPDSTVLSRFFRRRIETLIERDH